MVWAEALVEHLIKTGFDGRYGARALLRTIETVVIAPLAKYLLEHPGLKNSRLHLSLDGDRALLVTCAGAGQLET